MDNTENIICQYCGAEISSNAKSVNSAENGFNKIKIYL